MAVSVHLDIDSDPHVLSALIEGLTAANYVIMQRDPDAFPPLYETGVVYRREERGHDDWLTADAVLDRGFADCEDLAGYRAAELRREGVPARAVVIPNRSGNFHAVVLLPDGSYEDPSRILIEQERASAHG